MYISETRVNNVPIANNISIYTVHVSSGGAILNDNALPKNESKTILNAFPSEACSRGVRTQNKMPIHKWSREIHKRIVGNLE